MQEERLVILRLLEEGKITADEAQELLAALEINVDTSDPAPPPATPARPADPDTDVFEKLGSGLENIPALVENLLGGFGLFGSGHQFEETVEGEFGAGTDPVEVRLSSINGRVVVHAWDEPGYRVNLLKTVRAASEEKAAEKAADMVDITQEDALLSVSTRRGVPGVGMRIEAYLPRDRRFRLDAGSSNGRIEVHGLTADSITATTSNGRVVTEGCSVGEARLTSSNGRIVAHGVEGDLSAHTSNGRIEAAPAGGGGDRKLDLRTSNGSITLTLPRGDDHGYRVEARTSHGGITLSCPDIVVTEGEGKTTGEGVQKFKRYLRAESKDIGSRSHVTTVNATTSNGTIRIND